LFLPNQNPTFWKKYLVQIGDIRTCNLFESKQTFKIIIFSIIITLILKYLLLLNMVCSWIQIVGHSLGGGTAALLSYILQEQNVCASLCCVCFGPGNYDKYIYLFFS